MSFGPHQLLYRANITYSHAHHTIISTFQPSLSQSRPSKFSPSAIMHHKRNENNSPVQQFAFMCLSNGCKVNIYLILSRTCFTVLPFHQVNLSSYRLSVSFFSWASTFAIQSEYCPKLLFLLKLQAYQHNTLWLMNSNSTVLLSSFFSP